MSMVLSLLWRGFAISGMLADSRRRSQEKGEDASAGREDFSPCLEFDIVADPVGVPPFHGIDEDPVDEHGEMEMIAAGQARGSRKPDGLAARHALGQRDVDLAQM